MVKIFHMTGDKSQSHDFLFELLKAQYGINASEGDLRKSENGKLYLRDNPVFFSISHSKNDIVIAFSDSEVGIDTEIVKPTFPKKTIFNVNPTDCFNFYSLFTKAESIVKYKASSILLDLNKIDLSGKPKYDGKELDVNVTTFTDGNLIISFACLDDKYSYFRI